jgi:hypothetical protein
VNRISKLILFASLAALAVPAVAGAAKAPKTASFKASLKGE